MECLKTVFIHKCLHCIMVWVIVWLYDVGGLVACKIDLHIYIYIQYNEVISSAPADSCRLEVPPFRAPVTALSRVLRPTCLAHYCIPRPFFSFVPEHDYVSLGALSEYIIGQQHAANDDTVYPVHPRRLRARNRYPSRCTQDI